MKEKAALLYHSGAGSTKTVSEILVHKLEDLFNIEIKHIDFDYDYSLLTSYDVLILGFPTYHCEPSNSMMDFIQKMPIFKNSIKAFIFTTYGLYSGNALRITAKELKKKNVKVLDYFSFRSPASDGALLFPSSLKILFEYEKSFYKHLNFMADQIKNYKILPAKNPPMYKVYVPLNNIAKYFGEKEYDKMKNNIHIIPDRCTNCNLCVTNCERECWTSEEIMPVFTAYNCEFCLECIHKCPTKAIIFSEKMKDKPRLNKQFFNNQKRKYFINNREGSNAQQTIMLLKEGLGLHSNNKLRRKALLDKLSKKKYPETDDIDSVKLIIEDRER